VAIALRYVARVRASDTRDTVGPGVVAARAITARFLLSRCPGRLDEQRVAGSGGVDVLTVGSASQTSLSHEILENDATCDIAKPEQTRRLAEMQFQPGHLAIRSHDQPREMRSWRFAIHDVTHCAPPVLMP
jgi:hypothetical protein